MFLSQFLWLINNSLPDSTIFFFIYELPFKGIEGTLTLPVLFQIWAVNLGAGEGKGGKGWLVMMLMLMMRFTFPVVLHHFTSSTLQ